MRDPWVWPDNPAYPPWPHLRYPFTSKDEDPNKKILARQSCSRVQRTLLFYLAHTGYHALLHTKHANNSPTTRDTHIRMPLNARSMGSARQTGHTPPWPHLQKLHTEGQRTILFYLTHTGYHALPHTKHAAKPYNKRHPIQGAS